MAEFSIDGVAGSYGGVSDRARSLALYARRGKPTADWRPLRLGDYRYLVHLFEDSNL